MASFDYLYTPRPLALLAGCDLPHSSQLRLGPVRMAISVQRVVIVDPEVVITSRSNEHLQSRGFLNALIDGFTPSSEAVEETIMTFLSAMLEAGKSIRQCFPRQLVKLVFVLSPGYASLPEPLQFLFAMVVLLARSKDLRIIARRVSCWMRVRDLNFLTPPG